MRRYMLLFLCCCGFSAFAAEQTVVQAESKESLPLRDESNFVVYYAFSDKDLENSLKQVMITSLESLGTVYSGDDSKLSKKEKADKAKKGAVLEVIATNLIEESSQDPLKYTTLPVIELSLQALGEVEVLKSGHKQGGVIWEREKFLGTMPDQKELKEKITKAFEVMMQEFVQSYQKANPSSKKTEVKFFLYS
jgi:hypothetical protein